MQCPACQSEGRKFGKDRRGNQRYQCLACHKTFSERPAIDVPLEATFQAAYRGMPAYWRGMLEGREPPMQK